MLKEKLQSLGFTFGHLQIVIMAVAVLVGLAYFQTKTRDPDVFSKNGNEDTQSQGEANTKAVEDYTNQLANENGGINSDTGAVLGNSTNDGQNAEPIIKIQPRGPAVSPAGN